MKERICYIESGQIVNRAAIGKLFKELGDGTYLVRVSTMKRRSIPQNAYYWGVICEMVRVGLREVGYNMVKSPADAHEVMKNLFLKQQIVNEDTGEILVEYGRSTTELTTIEFKEYIESIIQWAAEYLGIVIPLPNEIIPNC